MYEFFCVDACCANLEPLDNSRNKSKCSGSGKRGGGGGGGSLKNKNNSGSKSGNSRKRNDKCNFGRKSNSSPTAATAAAASTTSSSLNSSSLGGGKVGKKRLNKCLISRNLSGGKRNAANPNSGNGDRPVGVFFCKYECRICGNGL